MSRGNYKNGIFDLHLSFASDITPEGITEWEASWAHASELLYDATHGQMRLGTLSYCFSALCPFADAWLIGQEGRSYSYKNISARKGQMNLWDQCRRRPYVILHEFAHYALYLKDEYDSAGHGLCIPRKSALEARACIMEWGWQWGDQIYGANKIQPGHIFEFCSHESCLKYDPERPDYKSCWDRIIDHYPDLKVPDVSKPFQRTKSAPKNGIKWEPIEWVESRCATNPLIYLDTMSDEASADQQHLHAAIENGLAGMADYREYQRASLEEIEQQQDVTICGSTLVLPVTSGIDVDEWKQRLQHSRVRVFPIAIADPEAENEDGPTAETWRELDELGRDTNGRLKIFGDSANLGLRVQSHLAELASEMNPEAGLCSLSEHVFAGNPQSARQSCTIPVEQFSQCVTFLLTIDGDMATDFVAVDPSGTKYRCSQPNHDGHSHRVYQITIDHPVPGNWRVNLGRTEAGEPRNGRLMAVSTNRHVHALFDAEVKSDGSILLSAHCLSHNLLLANLHVEARTLGPNPQRFNLTDEVRTGCTSSSACSVGKDEDRIYSTGWYTAELPAGTKISDVMISIVNHGKAYPPYWTGKEAPPPIPKFFRTQRLMVPPSREPKPEATAEAAKGSGGRGNGGTKKKTKSRPA